MIKKILILAAIAALVTAQARYPAGLNPALCPNYPYCDNQLMALLTPYPYTAPGYPANVNPAGCPHYPYCL